MKREVQTRDLICTEHNWTEKAVVHNDGGRLAAVWSDSARSRYNAEFSEYIVHIDRQQRAHIVPNKNPLSFL